MKAYLGFILVALAGDSPLNAFDLYIVGLGNINFCSKCESQIETTFINHYYNFIEDTKERNLKIMETPLVIKFGNLDSLSSIGACVIFSKGRTDLQRYIFVSRNYWDSASRQSQKSLMYHELAHCLLGVEAHSEGGIMGEFIPLELNDEMYEDFWKYVGENSSGSRP
jgi:hypothetical protein